MRNLNKGYRRIAILFGMLAGLGAVILQTSKRAWRWFLRKIKAWDQYSSFITAVATAVIAAFTIELYCVSNRQWQTMQQQLELSERPWVSIDQVEIASPLVFDKNPQRGRSGRSCSEEDEHPFRAVLWRLLQ